MALMSVSLSWLSKDMSGPQMPLLALRAVKLGPIDASLGVADALGGLSAMYLLATNEPETTDRAARR
jgi:hypothetical protein